MTNSRRYHAVNPNPWNQLMNACFDKSNFPVMNKKNIGDTKDISVEMGVINYQGDPDFPAFRISFEHRSDTSSNFVAVVSPHGELIESQGPLAKKQLEQIRIIAESYAKENFGLQLNNLTPTIPSPPPPAPGATAAPATPPPPPPKPVDSSLLRQIKQFKESGLAQVSTEQDSLAAKKTKNETDTLKAQAEQRTIESSKKSDEEKARKAHSNEKTGGQMFKRWALVAFVVCLLVGVPLALFVPELLFTILLVTAAVTIGGGIIGGVINYAAQKSEISKAENRVKSDDEDLIKQQEKVQELQQEKTKLSKLEQDAAKTEQTLEAIKPQAKKPEELQKIADQVGDAARTLGKYVDNSTGTSVHTFSAKSQEARGLQDKIERAL